MKKYLFLLLLLCGVSLVNSVSAQSRPKFKASQAFSHASASSEGRTNKVRFRSTPKGDFFDLHFKSIAQFRTAKSNKNYRFRKDR